MDEYPYPVCCPACGWFGMSDDCSHGRCPACTERVRKDNTPESQSASSQPEK